MDHFFQIQGVGEVDEPMLEGYTALATWRVSPSG